MKDGHGVPNQAGQYEPEATGRTRGRKGAQVPIRGGQRWGQDLRHGPGATTFLIRWLLRYHLVPKVILRKFLRKTPEHVAD